MKRLTIYLLVTGLMSANLQAAGDLKSTISEHSSDYRGQQNREIKSLSAEDVRSITGGKGWGMAKPAELNGYPGPRHVLDMADQLGLSADQRAGMERLFRVMRDQAIAAGRLYLSAEWNLEQAFQGAGADRSALNRASLRKLIDASERARSELRYVHLSTHLESIELLSGQQVAVYNRLRGYADGAGEGHGH